MGLLCFVFLFLLSFRVRAYLCCQCVIYSLAGQQSNAWNNNGIWTFANWFTCVWWFIPIESDSIWTIESLNYGHSLYLLCISLMHGQFMFQQFECIVYKTNTLIGYFVVGIKRLYYLGRITQTLPTLHELKLYFTLFMHTITLNLHFT